MNLFSRSFGWNGCCVFFFFSFAFFSSHVGLYISDFKVVCLVPYPHIHLHVHIEYCTLFHLPFTKFTHLYKIKQLDILGYQYRKQSLTTLISFIFVNQIQYFPNALLKTVLYLGTQRPPQLAFHGQEGLLCPQSNSQRRPRALWRTKSGPETETNKRKGT